VIGIQDIGVMIKLTVFTERSGVKVQGSDLLVFYCFSAITNIS